VFVTTFMIIFLFISWRFINYHVQLSGAQFLKQETSIVTQFRNYIWD